MTRNETAEPGDQWALITGASSGLGIELAKSLAARGIHLILTARREAPMHELAGKLKQQHGIDVIVEPADLTQPGSAAALKSRVDAREIAPSILINNAGFGLSGFFTGQSQERLQEMLHLNIVSLTELTHAFGKDMAARGRGHILLVASMAAQNPTPLLSAYGASKAYVLSLGEALHAEFAPKIGVTVLSPGLMDTGFNQASGYEAPESAMIRRTKLTPERVARIGLDAMFAGKSHVIAGRLNNMMALLGRFTPRRAMAKMVFNMAKK